MQRCVYTLNSDRSLSPKGLCTKIAIAKSSPTPILKRLRLIQITNFSNSCDELNKANVLNVFPALESVSLFDGCYATNKIRAEHWNTIKLLEYLQIAKEVYHLSDFDAMQLLGFFKTNFTEACRHLLFDNSRHDIILDFDSPWRLNSRSIRELPPMEKFTSHSFFKNFQQLYIVNSNVLTNVLPQQSLAEKFPGRYIRIQRSFYRGNVIWVACALPSGDEPIEVVALLLPSMDSKEVKRCTFLMDELEEYLAPLILASKSWTVLEHESENADILIQVLNECTAAMQGLLNVEVLKNKLPRDAVGALLKTYEILY
ncbi:hypothetical protein AWZ03_006832 [Drosophila navojoa]|uniref:Uncharacterized protein n=1 Tax=Drosophila navojoa TaxID=7232 RepID=A0A484BG72_DRONA|nr:hypothetical protein AWZ03_006832 [Drosophila navojoa]